MSGPPVRLYLDQNKWIELLKNPDAPVLENLRRWTAGGQIVIYLSASHYMETWHRGNWKSRRDLAALMRELTEYHALAPWQWCAARELDYGLRAVFGVPADVEAVVPYGRGVDFAFDSPTGRFRMISATVPTHGFEGELLDPPAAFERLKASPSLYEWVSLAGVADDLSTTGIDVLGQKRRGASYAEELRRKSAHLAMFSPEKIQQLVASDLFIVDILEAYNDRMISLGLDPRMLLDLGRSAILSIIDAMPVARTTSALLYHRVRNLEHPWNDNDLADVTALPVALTYVDHVCTERQWTNLAGRVPTTARAWSSLDQMSAFLRETM